MQTIQRYYYKCKDCFAIVATSDHYEEAKCDFCGGDFEYMGQVRKEHLVEEHEATPCDTRCTHAQGPLCVCRCCGENHGSGRMVKVVKFVSNVPWLTPNNENEREAHLHMAQESRALLNRYEQLFNEKYPNLLSMFQNRVWIKDRNRWLAVYDFTTSKKKAVAYKSHKSRMKLLHTKIAMLEALPTPEAEQKKVANSDVIPF